MNVIYPKAGIYVVAVSGGVDSVSLLHLLSQQPDLKLVVAHLDHGIRADSALDKELVNETAYKLRLPFVFEEAKLGPGASEALARKARYEFLNKTARDYDAQAIITAHHQDDLIETAIINMLRGSGRKGLTALNSRADILRPLLKVPKDDLVAYAKDQGLKWREDSTNNDDNYLRNYVRHKILTRFSNADRQDLLDIIQNIQTTNEELDGLLTKQLSSQSVADKVDRYWFNQLPHAVAREVIANWLRGNGIRSFDRKTLERLVVSGKTGFAGQKFPVLSGQFLVIGKDHLALKGPER